MTFATADGTATAGEDYAAVSGILTIKPGDTSAQIVVEVNGDLVDEFDEQFTVVLVDLRVRPSSTTRPAWGRSWTTTTA